MQGLSGQDKIKDYVTKNVALADLYILSDDPQRRAIVGSTSIYRKLGKPAFKMAISGLIGCTVLFVVSKEGRHWLKMTRKLRGAVQDGSRLTTLGYFSKKSSCIYDR